MRQDLTVTSGASTYLQALFDDIKRLEGMRDAAFTMLVKQAGITGPVQLVGFTPTGVTIEVPEADDGA